MAASSATLHENPAKLSGETVDQHRAIVSMMEELEAVDWYSQRLEACEDKELAALLAHNRNEEEEHFVMVLEWLRRRDANLNAQLETYLFKEGSILAAEAKAEGRGGAAGSASDGSLGIGSLRGTGGLDVAGG